MKEREKFEAWWKEQGQFCCASGQSDHKSVIFEAWLAGYHECLLSEAGFRPTKIWCSICKDYGTHYSSECPFPWTR